MSCACPSLCRARREFSGKSRRSTARGSRTPRAGGARLSCPFFPKRLAAWFCLENDVWLLLLFNSVAFFCSFLERRRLAKLYVPHGAERSVACCHPVAFKIQTPTGYMRICCLGIVAFSWTKKGQGAGDDRSEDQMDYGDNRTRPISRARCAGPHLFRRQMERPTKLFVARERGV